MKSRSIIATACHLFAPPSSTLLVKYSCTTNKVSVIAFFSPVDPSMTSYHCPPHEQPGSSGRTILVAATSQASVLHARSLLSSKQGSPIYIHVFVRSNVLGGGGACMLVAGTQDVVLGDSCFERPQSVYNHNI